MTDVRQLPKLTPGDNYHGDHYLNLSSIIDFHNLTNCFQPRIREELLGDPPPKLRISLGQAIEADLDNESFKCRRCGADVIEKRKKREADKRGFKDSQYFGHDIRSFKKKYKTSNRIEADQRGGRRYTEITLEIEYQIRQLVADNFTTTIQGIIDETELDSHIVYVDESPFNLHIFKSRGWSGVGTTTNHIVPISRGQNVTTLLTINCYNIIQCDAIHSILNPREEAFSILKNRERRDGVPQGKNGLVQRMTDSCEGIILGTKKKTINVLLYKNNHWEVYHQFHIKNVPLDIVCLKNLQILAHRNILVQTQSEYHLLDIESKTMFFIKGPTENMGMMVTNAGTPVGSPYIFPSEILNVFPFKNYLFYVSFHSTTVYRFSSKFPIGFLAFTNYGIVVLCDPFIFYLLKPIPAAAQEIQREMDVKDPDFSYVSVLTVSSSTRKPFYLGYLLFSKGNQSEAVELFKNLALEDYIPTPYFETCFLSLKDLIYNDDFVEFLNESKIYDHQEMLDLIESRDYLRFETITLLGNVTRHLTKLGRHRDALAIHITELDDFEGAISYCSQRASSALFLDLLDLCKTKGPEYDYIISRWSIYIEFILNHYGFDIESAHHDLSLFRAQDSEQRFIFTQQGMKEFIRVNDKGVTLGDLCIKCRNTFADGVVVVENGKRFRHTYCSEKDD
ncbi:hypothetical protein RF11_14829 [Thelohanellus kitauei]|uniref:Uncharacterized protein n=1 Tax=Thelohanellus kitauei TaxID=669202 RepID=A0A0C2N2B5_THEKT|nr:hypothetical protein RF11_14829 [Thelohanellus kitauei]